MAEAASTPINSQTKFFPAAYAARSRLLQRSSDKKNGEKRLHVDDISVVLVTFFQLNC
jgi:hypothetical protein